MNWTVLMFSTASSAMVVETIYVLHASMTYFAAVKTQDYSGLNHYLLYDTLRSTSYTLSDLLLFASNVLADCILIHRYYLIWNHKRMSVLLVAACLLANMTMLTGVTMITLGHIYAKSERSRRLESEGETILASAMVASGVINVILTCLTAGRLWWIGIRSTSSAGAQTIYAKRYRSVLRI
ncbi:hypothetical protein PQX77_013428, partial [Marasmius sp. AFHP31]